MGRHFCPLLRPTEKQKRPTEKLHSSFFAAHEEKKNSCVGQCYELSEFFNFFNLLKYNDFFQLGSIPAMFFAGVFLGQIFGYCAIGTIIELCVRCQLKKFNFQ